MRLFGGDDDALPCHGNTERRKKLEKEENDSAKNGELDPCVALMVAIHPQMGVRGGGAGVSPWKFRNDLEIDGKQQDAADQQQHRCAASPMEHVRHLE